MYIGPMIISHTCVSSIYDAWHKSTRLSSWKRQDIKLKKLNKKKKESGWVRASSFLFNSLFCVLQVLH